MVPVQIWAAGSGSQCCMQYSVPLKTPNWPTKRVGGTWFPVSGTHATAAFPSFTAFFKHCASECNGIVLWFIFDKEKLLHYVGSPSILIHGGCGMRSWYRGLGGEGEVVQIILAKIREGNIRRPWRLWCWNVHSQKCLVSDTGHLVLHAALGSRTSCTEALFYAWSTFKKFFFAAL